MKNSIINKIRPAQEFIDLPDLSKFKTTNNLNIAELKSRVEETGCAFFELTNDTEIVQKISELYPNNSQICDTTFSFGIGNFDINIIDNSKLSELDVCIIKAQFIVEENGAIWVSEEDVKNRILLCVAEHLVVIVSKTSIVGNMHDAYQNIRNRNNNYGVFVCGPSKTADIAQTLVIGAHGPKSMTIILT